MISTREKVTGALSWTLLPRVVQIVASIYTSILIVRSLGQFDYGTLSVLRTLLAIVVLICGFGLGQAINRFVPELRVTEQWRVGRGLLYRSLLLQSVLWGTFSVLLLAFRGVLLRQVPTYADLLILGVALSAAEVAAGSISQYAIAIYRTRELAISSTLGTAFMAAGTGILLHVGLRVPGVLLAVAAGHAVNAAALSVLLRGTSERATQERETRIPFSWNRLLAYAVPWIPNNLLNYVVWRQSETLLLGIYRSRVEAGYFDLAYKLPQMVLEFVPTSIYPLVLAGFAETSVVAKDRMPAVISFYYRLLFFVVAPLSLLGLAMGDVLLARMYGVEMAQAGPYCQAFFVIFTLTFFGTPLSMTVYIVEKVWINLLLNLGYAVVTIGLDLLLIPKYGLLGATLPTAAVTAATPFVRYAVARRYLDRIEIPWKFILRAYLASLPLLSLFFVKGLVHNLRGLALVLAGSALVALLSYRLCRVLGPEERGFLERSRVPGRSWILRIL
jgi:O-antigen/teichoic acid export membrane protein